MTSTEQDLLFLTESLPQLQDYLLSNELYWPLTGALPRLTLGSLLLALARMSVIQPEAAKKMQLQVETIRAKWKVAWEQKSARETANRLRLWSSFVSDYRNAPDQHADFYPQEVRGRVILQLLLAEAPDAPEKSALADLDIMLKSRLVSGNFVWNAALQVAFPKTDFWFLYGTIAP
jgi:hypothetical protein